MTEDELIAFRDPNGWRPLCLGKLNGSYVIASETCAFDLIDAKYERDIEPGEIVIINAGGLKSIKTRRHGRKSHCIFELIYFARPDSKVFGCNVYDVRKNSAKSWLKNTKSTRILPCPSPIPETTRLSLLPQIGILWRWNDPQPLCRRTFIAPSQSMRDFGVK